MMKHVEVSPRTILTDSFWVIAALIICVIGARGQGSGGPYANVNKWYVAYEIVIKTKDKCCDILSRETFHGEPTRRIHYSIDHEFEGAFELSGPILGMGLTTRPDADTKRNPMLAAQLAMEKLTKHPGWQYPMTGKEAKPTVHAIIKDEIDQHSINPGEGKYEQDIDTLDVSKYEGDIISDFGHSLLSFDLEYNRYDIDFSVTPVNLSDNLVVKRSVTETVVTKNDPNNEPDHHNTTESTDPLRKYLFFSSQSFEGNAVKFKGGSLGNIAESFSIWQFEKLTKVHGLPGEVIADIQKTNTLEVRIHFVVSKRPLAGLSGACK